MDEYMIDDQRTTLPWLMLSLKSDIMDCKVARRRLPQSRNSRSGGRLVQRRVLALRRRAGKARLRNRA